MKQYVDNDLIVNKNEFLQNEQEDGTVSFSANNLAAWAIGGFKG